MVNITQLPHTADIRLQIEAGTLEELFLAGLKGLGSQLKEGLCDQETKFSMQETIQTNSIDTSALLVDFLNDVLTKSYAEQAVFCRAEFSELTDTSVQATVYGQQVDDVDEDIKAVTYHEADVCQNDAGNWQTNLIFDI